MAIEGSRQEHGAGRIRLGMVGGGSAFIEPVHRIAAASTTHSSWRRGR